MSGSVISPEKSVYVGCSLTGAPQTFISEVEAFKDTLRTRYNVFDFVGLTNGSSEDVYRWDIEHCVADCDAFVAICDYPSIGLGWEISEAVRLNKPTLAVAHETSPVTRLLLGAATVKSTLAFQRYFDLISDVPSMVEQQLAL